MKNLLISLFVVSAMTTSIFAQTNFTSESAAWHKKAIIICGTLKAPNTIDTAKLAKDFVQLTSDLESLTTNYKTNPPAEYKNDPLWANYFVDLADNLTVVKYFAEQQQYRIAAKNCSMFCQTFLKMHKNNGTVDLTDMLFSLNMQMKLTTDISNTGNAEGAKKNIELVNKILNHATMKVKKSNADLQTMFIPVEKTAKDWIKAIENGDAKTAKELYGSFAPIFRKLFISSL